MGCIRCERHGESNIAFVSEAVMRSVLDPTLPWPKIAKLTLHAGGELQSVHEVDMQTIDELIREGAIAPDLYQVSSEELSFDIFCRLKGVVCVHCLDEWLARAPVSN
jgi:hypothetical protein